MCEFFVYVSIKAANPRIKIVAIVCVCDLTIDRYKVKLISVRFMTGVDRRTVRRQFGPGECPSIEVRSAGQLLLGRGVVGVAGDIIVNSTENWNPVKGQQCQRSQWVVIFHSIMNILFNKI